MNLHVLTKERFWNDADVESSKRIHYPHRLRIEREKNTDGKVEYSIRRSVPTTKSSTATNDCWWSKWCLRERWLGKRKMAVGTKDGDDCNSNPSHLTSLFICTLYFGSINTLLSSFLTTVLLLEVLSAALWTHRSSFVCFLSWSTQRSAGVSPLVLVFGTVTLGRHTLFLGYLLVR